MRIFNLLTEEEYVVVKSIFVDATKKTLLKDQLHKTMDEIKQLRESAKKKVKHIAEALKVAGPINKDYNTWFKQHLPAVKTLMEEQSARLAAGEEKKEAVESPSEAKSASKKNANKSYIYDTDAVAEKPTKKRKKTSNTDEEKDAESSKAPSKNKKRKLNEEKNEDKKKKKKSTKAAVNVELDNRDALIMTKDAEESFDPEQYEEEEEEEEDSDMEGSLLSESDELSDVAEIEINKDRIYSIRCEDQVRYMWFNTAMEKKQFWTNLRAALRDKFPFKLEKLFDVGEKIDAEVVLPEFDVYKLKFKHVPFEKLSSDPKKRDQMWKHMLNDESDQSFWHELIMQWLGNYLEWANNEFFKKKETKEAK